jgi:hypothetical protein
MPSDRAHTSLSFSTVSQVRKCVSAFIYAFGHGLRMTIGVERLKLVELP